jgi:hypothetical protein
MEKVTGIGGLFFRARDPLALKERMKNLRASAPVVRGPQ